MNLRILSPLILAVWSALPALGEEGSGAFFRNEASRAGIAGVKTVRCRFARLDGDFWPDIVLGSDKVFLGAESGGRRSFRDVTESSGFGALFGAGGEKKQPVQFCLAADVDNDGDTDLFVARYCEPEKPSKGVSEGIPKAIDGHLAPGWKDHGARSCILLNDGKGGFTRREDSGVEEPAETTCAGTFVDVDNDGILDLFTGNFYVAYGWSYDAYPDRLFKGLGGGRFSENTSRAGLFTHRRSGYRNSSRPTYGVAHCDWNGDGWQDLLVCAYG
ncbi:MAG: FG-GAP repeat domain-containing protein, partial [Planctomycetota bacterium]